LKKDEKKLRNGKNFQKKIFLPNKKPPFHISPFFHLSSHSPQKLQKNFIVHKKMAGKWLAKDGDKSFNLCFNLIIILFLIYN